MLKKVIKYNLLALVCCAALCGCTAKDDATAQTPEAMEQGLADAKALLGIPVTDTRELHSALLSVKSREWEMRRKGNDVAADAYINAFKDYVIGHDKSMADEIF